MTLAKLITMLEQQRRMKQEELLNLLATEYEAAKEQTIKEYKLRGMSSGDVAKYNAEVRITYAKAGLLVTSNDFMQDLCAQTLRELTEAYLDRIQEIYATHEK